MALRSANFEFDPRHAGEMAEDVGVEPLEIGQVAGDDLHQVVARPRHQVATEHVGAGGKAALERAERVVVLALERDLDEGGDAEADGVRVDERPVAGNDAGRLEVLDAPRAGRGREANADGKLDRRQPAVLGERRNDLPVELIHLHGFTEAKALSDEFVQIRACKGPK